MYWKIILIIYIILLISTVTLFRESTRLIKKFEKKDPKKSLDAAKSREYSKSMFILLSAFLTEHIISKYWSNSLISLILLIGISVSAYMIYKTRKKYGK